MPACVPAFSYIHALLRSLAFMRSCMRAPTRHDQWPNVGATSPCFLLPPLLRTLLAVEEEEQQEEQGEQGDQEEEGRGGGVGDDGTHWLHPAYVVLSPFRTSLVPRRDLLEVLAKKDRSRVHTFWKITCAD